MDRELAARLARYAELAYQGPDAVRAALPGAQVAFLDRDSTADVAENCVPHSDGLFVEVDTAGVEAALLEDVRELAHTAPDIEDRRTRLETLGDEVGDRVQSQQIGRLEGPIILLIRAHEFGDPGTLALPEENRLTELHFEFCAGPELLEKVVLLDGQRVANSVEKIAGC